MSTIATAAPKKKANELSFIENFLLSGVAAATSKTGAAPIERIKLLVQNQGEMLKQGLIDKPYKGVADCAVRTMKTEGIFSFWRGNLANCIRYFPTQALNFAIKDKVHQTFKIHKDDSFLVSLSKNCLSGGVAGSVSLFFVYSLDFARTRLSNDLKSTKKAVNTGKPAERQFRGLSDVYIKTMKTDGIQGLYRGFVISCVGIFIYRGFYFGLYDTLKPVLLKPDSLFVLSFALGYGCTVLAGLLSYPIDTIRRRMMMTSGQAVKYKGSLDCFAQVVKSEGLLSTFNGAGANILRGIAGAGVLSGFDKLVAWYAGGKIKLNTGGA